MPKIMPIEPLQLIVDKIDELKKDNKTRFEEFKVDNEEQHNRIMNRVYKIDEATDKNTEFRIGWKAKIDVWKYLIGILGIGNVINFVYMYLAHYQH